MTEWCLINCRFSLPFRGGTIPIYRDQGEVKLSNSFASINITTMADPQHYNLVVIHVEDHSIIPHSKTIGPKFSAGQFGCKLIWVIPVPFQAVADALQCCLVKFV